MFTVLAISSGCNSTHTQNTCLCLLLFLIFFDAISKKSFRRPMSRILNIFLVGIMDFTLILKSLVILILFFEHKMNSERGYIFLTFYVLLAAFQFQNTIFEDIISPPGGIFLPSLTRINSQCNKCMQLFYSSLFHWCRCAFYAGIILLCVL